MCIKYFMQSMLNLLILFWLATSHKTLSSTFSVVSKVSWASSYSSDGIKLVQHKL